MNLKSVLIMHANLYPKMEIQDAVKLVYQNEFGGGHLIRDEQESFRRLTEEYAASRKTGLGHQAGPLFVNIGNGMCRLDLSVLEDRRLSIYTANRFFVNTANDIKGSIAGFEAKLDILWQCCWDGKLKYPPDDLEAYLEDYRNRGYPPVGHSATYKAAYKPAYRIVKAEYCAYLEVFRAIDALMASGRRVTVAIDGNSGAGKSALGALIAEVYDCNLFHMDHFFLRPEQRTEERLHETGGFVDYERFHREVIQGLECGRPFSYRVFDCGEMALGEEVRVEPKQLNIIEGSYSMHPTLAGYYDLKIFLQVAPEEQARRILRRNGEAMLKRFLSEWIPRENKYFEEMGIREQCHLVFRTDDAMCCDPGVIPCLSC